MDQKLEFAERLRAAMLAAGLEVRPGVLLNLFNTHYWGQSVSFQAVSRWLRGESIPAQDKLITLAEVLKSLGHERAWVVHGAGGLDELSTLGPSQVAELKDGKVVAEHKLLEDVGQRMRDVRQGPDGLLYVVTDSPNGRLIRVLPQ